MADKKDSKAAAAKRSAAAKKAAATRRKKAAGAKSFPTGPQTMSARAPRAAGKPVIVTQYTRRSGEDALPGGWVDVVSGEHKGRRGAYLEDETYNPQTGYPERVVVRSRDADNELLIVNYEDIRPCDDYRGGR